jgi:hypothetical protein
MWRSPEVMLEEVRGRAAGRRRARRIRIGAAGVTAVAGALLILPQAQATRPHTVRVADNGRVPVSTAGLDAAPAPDAGTPSVSIVPRPGGGGRSGPKAPGSPTTTSIPTPATALPAVGPNNALRLVPAVEDAAHDEVGNDGTTDVIWATIAYSGPTDTMDFVTTVRDMGTNPLSVEYSASFSWDNYSYGVYSDMLPNAKPSVSVGGEKCDGCQVLVDMRTNRATVRVPMKFLNDVVKHVSSQGSGLPGPQRPASPALAAGSTISNLTWHSARIRPVGSNGWTTDVPDNHDDAMRVDPWKIPEI